MKARIRKIKGYKVFTIKLNRYKRLFLLLKNNKWLNLGYCGMKAYKTNLFIFFSAEKRQCLVFTETLIWFKKNQTNKVNTSWKKLGKRWNPKKILLLFLLLPQDSSALSSSVTWALTDNPNVGLEWIFHLNLKLQYEEEGADVVVQQIKTVLGIPTASVGVAGFKFHLSFQPNFLSMCNQGGCR